MYELLAEWTCKVYQISRDTPLAPYVFTCLDIHILVGVTKGLKSLSFQSKSSFLCSCKITNIKSVDYIFLKVYGVNGITNVGICVIFNKQFSLASLINQTPNWGCALILIFFFFYVKICAGDMHGNVLCRCDT